MSRIYLMRHGQIVQRHPRPFVGCQDIPLDETGRGQAAQIAAALADVGLRRIVSSDLSRCLETSSPLAAAVGLEIEPEPQLREINLGLWEGLTSAEVQQLYPEEYLRRGSDIAGARPNNGESFVDLAGRVWPVFRQIAHEAEYSGPTLVMAHAGVNRVLLCRLLGMPVDNLMRLDQSYACLNIVDRNAWGLCLTASNITLSGLPLQGY